MLSLGITRSLVGSTAGCFSEQSWWDKKLMRPTDVLQPGLGCHLCTLVTQGQVSRLRGGLSKVL